MTSPGTYLRTLRHLRWEQVVLRAAKPLRRPRVDETSAPPKRVRRGPWGLPAQRRPSLTAPTTWTLLGEARRLEDIGWDDPSVPLLWRYNQHYFDDVAAFAAAERRAWQTVLARRWIAECTPGRGTAWAPYPTSLRIVNWLKWLMADDAPTGDDVDVIAHSICVQARWLRDNLETHVLGNHLFVNAKALMLAGLFFEGAEADGWRATADAILLREVPEQILADGMQYERSPMYHALALEDALDLVNMARAFNASLPETVSLSPLVALAPRMHRVLRALTHDDGTLARFNDTADGIAPDSAELARYARALDVADDDAALPDGALALMPAGYVRLSRGPAMAIVDVAPVAPDYLMAHGHADTLAFELALGGRRVIVNGGTSRYGTDDARVRERGTYAHSTVTVDGTDSSEVWAGFRCGRRARVFDVSVSHDADALVVAGAHDGYQHLPGRPTHRRQWRLSDGELSVRDEVSPAPAAAIARYHFAPGLRVEGASDDWRVLRVDTGELVCRVHVEGGRAGRGLSQWSPSFGVVVAAESLDVEFSGMACSTTWRW